MIGERRNSLLSIKGKRQLSNALAARGLSDIVGADSANSNRVLLPLNGSESPVL